MTTLSRRQLANRYFWRPIRDPETCGHHDTIYLLSDQEHVQRACFFCGRPFADAELRCLALISDGSRRCLAPGRHDGLCRAHRWARSISADVDYRNLALRVSQVYRVRSGRSTRPPVRAHRARRASVAAAGVEGFGRR